MGRQATWDTHDISGNVFANPDASSTAPCPQELNPWSSGMSEPIHSSLAEKNENQTPVQDLRYVLVHNFLRKLCIGSKKKNSNASF